jgi:hypothetical protein
MRIFRSAGESAGDRSWDARDIAAFNPAGAWTRPSMLKEVPMLSRREVLAGGLVGGLAGNSTGEVVEEQPGEREALRQIEQAIESVETTLERGYNSLPLSQDFIPVLRKHFENFIRGNGKFPDFCDIGLACFYQVYDWHVRNRQQIMVTRQADNRYTIQYMFTTLILRFENELNFVGIPYDKA